MGGWIYPEFLTKGVNPKDLDDGMILYYHDNLHVFWAKLESGFRFDWTFIEVYALHDAIVKEMKKRGIPHYVPINNLDNIKLEAEEKVKKEEKKQEEEIKVEIIELGEQKVYSVEKKMNGFHASIHKKGDEVKIFSEQKKDITHAFKTLVESIKKIGDTFIIDGELVPFDEKGKVLGRNALMKYMGAVKSGKEVDDSILKILNLVVVLLDPQKIPRGLDNFRTFNRLSKAFEKAEKSGILELEETDYKFLKDTVVNNIPSTLGLNRNAHEAVEKFINVEEVN